MIFWLKKSDVLQAILDIGRVMPKAQSIAADSKKCSVAANGLGPSHRPTPRSSQKLKGSTTGASLQVKKLSVKATTIKLEASSGRWVALTPAKLKFVPQKYHAKKRSSAGSSETLDVDVSEITPSFENEQYWTRFLDEVASEYSSLEPSILRLHLVSPGPNLDLDADDWEHAKWSQEVKKKRAAMVRSLLLEKGVPSDLLDVVCEDGPDPVVFVEILKPS